MENVLQGNSSIVGNKLNINVDNLGELKSLIEDVKHKEKALRDAVQKLETFQLEISFTNE